MATGEPMKVTKITPIQTQPPAPMKVTKITPVKLAPMKVTKITPVASPVAKTSRTADEVKADPAAMKQVRDYMTSRKGTQIDNLSDEELYDTFINHMRYFNTNEVFTVGELRWLYGQEEEGKAKAGNAYQVYDSLGNVFVNDGLMGAVDGVADYTAAVLTSPSSWVGLGVGKAVVGSASKAAASTATKVAMEAAKKVAIKEAIKKGAAQGVKGTALREAAKVAGDKAAKDVAVKAARGIALKQAGVATATDAGLNVLQDFGYQKTQMEAGVQDEYSALQGTIAAAAGIVGGGLAYFPQATRGLSGLEDASARMLAGKKAQQRVARKNLAPAAKNMATKLAQRLDSWKDAVAKGQDLTDSIEFTNKVIDNLLRPADDGSPALLQEMLTDAGITIERGADDVRVMEQVVDFTRKLDPKTKKEMDDMFMPTLGIRFDDMMDIMAATLSRGGSNLGASSKFAENVNKVVKAQKEADALIVKTAAEDAKKAAKEEAASPRILEYVQSVWRRALVSHPATTAVNIKGWGITNLFGTAAEIAYAAASGAAGLALATVPTKGAKTASTEALRRSQALFAAQVFKVRTLLDPYTTKEAAEEFFNTLPKKYQKMIGESTFGVDTRDAASYGLNPKNGLVKGSERFVDKAATYSGLKLQDAYTKSISVMGELDRLARINYGKGIASMLENGEAHLISDDVWTKAINKGLKDTFSADYTKGNTFLSGMASFVEKLSSTPGLGFIFPFGRFMNNAMAFTLQYSPLAMLPLVSDMVERGILNKKVLTDLTSDETMMTLAKATVGTLALVTLAKMQEEKEKQGLAWNQELDSTGAITNIDNLAPIAAYHVLGRIASLYMRGEKVGDELLTDASVQLVVGQLIRDVGIGSGLSEMAKYVLSLTDDEVGQKDFGKMLMDVSAFVGGEVVSGFMRPFEPLNIAANITTDNDMAIDRRQLRGKDALVANTFRYIDVVFAPFLEPDENGRRHLGKPQQALTKEGPQREPNPLARLFGRREEVPLTNADKMLNKVNLPIWTQSERTGLPEWDAMVHEKITWLLEKQATALLKSERWRDANQRQRAGMVNQLMKGVKQRARNIVIDSSFEGREKDTQRKWLSKDDDLRTEAKSYFDLKDVPDHELTIPQIEMMEYWIKNTSDSRKRLAE